MKTSSPMILAAIAVFAVLVISNTFFIVDQRETAVMFQVGQLKQAGFEPGLHTKIPFYQTVRKFDSRILTLDNQTENFLTGEKKNVEVDFFVKWRIADPASYYRSTGGQELVALDRLSAIVNRGLRDEFGSRTIQQAVSDERDVIMQELERKVANNVKELGIEIVDVRLKSINLPQSVSESVYDRMRAERARVASDLRARGAEEAEKIRAEADREAQVTLANAYKSAEELRGEGDAKAADIYARVYGQDTEFYSFYRSLNVYRSSFGGGQDVLVLQPDGPFFKYFRGSGQ
ncbi:protease modulator HflC [Sinimarinibacterium sp. CAU 1509]|uniref:protease modulator HflC n=1 Tax=Sinimarinibacterium sp. CAU 1509 TaxID=2562283 RepID=UPI0010AD049B|nr:protease modulator HflC [Sinimarinibacterium sp. CAU 1509]TJY60923.1 protease modulator HflC [Sinimarinibacterium sp. CAU 1509]